MVFNHVLRQHRHADQSLHILELVQPSVLSFGFYIVLGGSGLGLGFRVKGFP